MPFKSIGKTAEIIDVLAASSRFGTGFLDEIWVSYLVMGVAAGNADSLLTISSYGRGLNLYDQGVRDPISLLSGSAIGTN